MSKSSDLPPSYLKIFKSVGKDSSKYNILINLLLMTGLHSSFQVLSDYEKISLIYAYKNGLFDMIKENQPISLDGIISKSKMAKRCGEALINVLTALGNLGSYN